jgi:hypothetical protein
LAWSARPLLIAHVHLAVWPYRNAGKLPKRLGQGAVLIPAAVESAAEAQKPARRQLPPHLPGEELRHPAPCTCPSCGGALRKIGDELTETLDYVPGRFKVIRHIRAKLSCRACDTSGG